MPGANDPDAVASDAAAAREEVQQILDEDERDEAERLKPVEQSGPERVHSDAEGDSEDEAVWAAELERRNEGDGNGNPQHRKPVDE